MPKSATTSVYSQLRLPQYEISRQADNLPPGITVLLGRWEGIWERAGVPTALVIQKIYPNGRKGDLIYAWGFWGPMKEKEPGHIKIPGDLIPGLKPVIKFHYAHAEYAFSLEEGQLIGLREQENRTTNRIVMEKVE